MSLHVYNLNNLPTLNKPIFMIGSFESFHAGHNMLFEKAKELSKGQRDIVIVYFDDVENLPKNNTGVFTDHLFRLQAFAGIGFNIALQLKYIEIRQLSPKEFIDKIVKNQTDYDIVTGTDFRFGLNASGNIKTLDSLLNNNFHAVELMKLNGEHKISTSFIKECVLSGDLDLVNFLNLFKFGFNSKITKINNELLLEFDSKLVKMRPGVYCANIEVDDLYYYCLLLVKNNGSRTIEMIDFDWKSLSTFNCKITVNMLLRPFLPNSLEESITEDFERSKEYFIFQSQNYK
ncbi:riboflavin biosynthesis protein [Mycoplasma sp. ES3157-GEN-MYC]|uniref:FAD synthase n=1 Tax=Mycoplasma miroungigenitalium TaxID=754515 RepID=A0A6M4J8T9_9MOLU|nr:riboflavin biosynthesis protein [Mycoplasma miroungigenitalium]MBU4690228.1 riboflavin biosynthesis protein [Mycoplasma miroungigenitalium]MBU4691495.1 riboflavin biosynthesis protein [Mycoplasma miroungigenitalium]QJR43330.1 riboflavin biosynthesis protein [Mycoplasma miroungigenitalium]